MIDLEVILFLYLLTSERWASLVPSAVSGSECRRRSKGRGRSERSERGLFRALKLRPLRQVLFLARHASENAFGVAGAVLRAFENAFGTPEGRFRYRISLPYRKSLFFTPNASENASRTPGGLFEHRMRIPYRRRLFPVPNFTN